MASHDTERGADRGEEASWDGRSSFLILTYGASSRPCRSRIRVEDRSTMNGILEGMKAMRNAFNAKTLGKVRRGSPRGTCKR